MARNSSSKSKKEAYSRYEREQRCVANRTRRLLKHIKKHPEDVQAKGAVSGIKYRRKKPTSRIWRGTNKNTMTALAAFTKRC